jgi:hypothetical protein
MVPLASVVSTFLYFPHLLDFLQTINFCLPSASGSTYPSTLEMEAVYSSETLVNSYQSIERHIPEDSILHALQEQEGRFPNTFF